MYEKEDTIKVSSFLFQKVDRIMFHTRLCLIQKGLPNCLQRYTFQAVSNWVFLLIVKRMCDFINVCKMEYTFINIFWLELWQGLITFLNDLYGEYCISTPAPTILGEKSIVNTSNIKLVHSFLFYMKI